MLHKNIKFYLSTLFVSAFITHNIELSAQTPLHFNISNEDNEGVAFAILYVPEIDVYTKTDFEGHAMMSLDKEVHLDSIELIISHVFHKTRTIHLNLSELNYEIKKPKNTFFRK